MAFIMFRERSFVVLDRDLPGNRLLAGDVGVVVHVYRERYAYEIEFVDGGGATVAIVTVKEEDIRLLEPGEILHTRRRDENVD